MNKNYLLSNFDSSKSTSDKLGSLVTDPPPPKKTLFGEINYELLLIVSDYGLDDRAIEVLLYPEGWWWDTELRPSGSLLDGVRLNT
jgi:hypothetical protein